MGETDVPEFLTPVYVYAGGPSCLERLVFIKTDGPPACYTIEYVTGPHVLSKQAAVLEPHAIWEK